MLVAMRTAAALLVLSITGKVGPDKAAYAQAQAIQTLDPLTKFNRSSWPPLGDPHRVEHMIRDAETHYRDHNWLNACHIYQQVISEAGIDALNRPLEQRDHAARSFHKCARLAFRAHDDQDVESYLGNAEKLGLHSIRHEVLRRKLVRRQYHRRLAVEDVDGALSLYTAYQAAGPIDEDERIWLGEQLATRAQKALDIGNRENFLYLMQHLEAISPRNRDFRALKQALKQDQNPILSVVGIIGAIVGGILLLSQITTWIAWLRVYLARRRHPYLKDDS